MPAITDKNIASTLVSYGGQCNTDTDGSVKWKTDGHASARRAVADLTIALCAEAVAASINEEAAKVDFKITFRSLFGERSLLSVHCQVKAGLSYVAYQDACIIKLITMKETVAVLQLGTQPSMTLWVEPRPHSRVFWHIVRLRYPHRKRIIIPASDYISPALYVDLSRHSRFFVGSSRPARIQAAVHVTSKKELRHKSLADYKKLQVDGLPSYLGSKVEVTRLGWRHITRRSRSAAKREVSFRLIPYLKNFLRMRPSRFLVTNKILRGGSGEVTIERRDVIYWYERAVLLDGIVSTVLIRISEEITFPREWRKHGLSGHEIQINAKLLSWWCKPTKKVEPRGSDTDTSGRISSLTMSSKSRMVEDTTD